MEQSKFILEIHSRPCIWDPRLKSYFDRYKKRVAWEEIGAKMYPDFQYFSDDQKREAVLELQRNWKSLKDYYNRRNPNDDFDKRTQRKKPIIELLQFLDIDIKLNQETQTIPQPVTLAENNINKNIALTISQYKKPFVILKQKSTVESLETNNLEQNSNIDFLQSILPEMQSLDDRQRFEFKLGVMKLIKKIKYDVEAETHNTSNNTNHTQIVQRCAHCESYECFQRSASPVLFTISRCNDHHSPVIYEVEFDGPAQAEYEYNQHNYCKVLSGIVLPK